MRGLKVEDKMVQKTFWSQWVGWTGLQCQACPQDIEGPPHVKIKMAGEETEFSTHLLRKQIMTNDQSWTNFIQTEIEEIFALC